MPTYRRNLVAGGCHFFTVNLAERRLRLLTDHVDLLRAAFRYARRRHPFAIDAIAVLPDHLHTIWTMPEGDADFAVRWALIKASFSRTLHKGEPISASVGASANAASGSAAIGSTRSATKTTSRGTSVKHGHVACVADWPSSSFHRMVRLGFYPESWAGDPKVQESGFGER
jgi:putative transposase